MRSFNFKYVENLNSVLYLSYASCVLLDRLFPGPERTTKHTVERICVFRLIGSILTSTRRLCLTESQFNVTYSTETVQEIIWIMACIYCITSELQCGFAKRFSVSGGMLFFFHVRMNTRLVCASLSLSPSCVTHISNNYLITVLVPKMDQELNIEHLVLTIVL